jgi:hypothetical protein
MRTWMPQQPQQLDLPQYPSRVRDVVEHVVDLLNGHLLTRLVVDCRAHDAVRPFADDLLDGVAIGFPVLREKLRAAAAQLTRSFRRLKAGQSRVASAVE